MELSQDVEHRPLVFIRFNPDDYFDERGEKVTSCWGVNKHGLAVVKNSKVVEWQARIAALTTQVQYWMDNPTDKTVEVVELFYDLNLCSSSAAAAASDDDN